MSNPLRSSSSSSRGGGGGGGGASTSMEIDMNSTTKILEEMEEYHDDDDDYDEDAEENFHDEPSNANHHQSFTSSTQTRRRGRTAALCSIAFAIILMVTLLGIFRKAPEKAQAEAGEEEQDTFQSVVQSTTTSSAANPTIPTTNNEPPPSKTSTSTSASTATEQEQQQREQQQGCIQEFKDRFDNEHNYQHNKLYPGQYICSHNSTNNHEEDLRYRFGVSPQGNLVLEDTKILGSGAPHNHNKYNKIFYKNENLAAATSGDYYFSLRIDGTWVLHQDDSSSSSALLWTASPNKDMHLTTQCLNKHDCPYLHLHADGVLVINYIDDNYKWQAKNALHVYGFF